MAAGLGLGLPRLGTTSPSTTVAETPGPRRSQRGVANQAATETTRTPPRMQETPRSLNQPRRIILKKVSLCAFWNCGTLV